MRVSPEFAMAVALLRMREAGGEVTDTVVLDECATSGIDPVPVMIMVQQKAPAAWPAYLEEPDGFQFVCCTNRN